MQNYQNKTGNTKTTDQKRNLCIRATRSYEQTLSCSKCFYINHFKPEKMCSESKGIDKKESYREDARKPRMEKGNSWPLMDCVVASSVICSPPQSWKHWANGSGFVRSSLSPAPHSSCKGWVSSPLWSLKAKSCPSVWGRAQRQCGQKRSVSVRN